MIVDTSALVAILRGEGDADALLDAIAATDPVGLSAASYLECGVVIDRLGDPVLSRRFDELLAELGITIEPVTARQAVLARVAYRDFGRGTGHPAALNFGDCFSYALATDRREPLLYKGDDFGHTDVMVALG